MQPGAAHPRPPLSVARRLQRLPGALGPPEIVELESAVVREMYSGFTVGVPARESILNRV